MAYLESPIVLSDDILKSNNALTKASLENAKQRIENQYMPDKMRLANENQNNINKWYEPNIQSEIAGRNALTNKTNTMTPLEAEKQKKENEWFDRKAQADINYKNMGGGRGSTGAKDDLFFQQSVAKDNPQLTSEDQIREAANVLAEGGDSLSDGTPINQMSPTTHRAYDRAFKSTSNAGLIKAGVQANQADAELTALTDHTTPVIKEMGTTFGNKSINQITDSFSSDEKSQKRLGRIIGARSLQYAIAQLRNRIDMGEPGINATQELMSNSGQVIDLVAPRITPAARLEAQNYINEGVRKALAARNKVGVGAGNAAGFKVNNTKSGKNSHWVFNTKTGQLEAK